MSSCGKVEMAKSNSSAITAVADTTSPENSVKNEKKKRSIIPKIFSSKKNERVSSDDDLSKLIDKDGGGVDLGKGTIAARRQAFIDASPNIRKSFSERQPSPGIEGLNLSNFERSMTPPNETKDFRVFVATWNVGGKTPNNDLNLEDFLQVEGSADIYVIGFQEIVPLNAGNVLVIEDNEPAAKWLTLINQAINRPRNDSVFDVCDYSKASSNSNKDPKTGGGTSGAGGGGLPFFQKPSLKVLSRNLRPIDCRLLKACNCPIELPSRERRLRKLKLDETTSGNNNNNNNGSVNVNVNVNVNSLISPELGSENGGFVDQFISISELASSNSNDGIGNTQMSYHLISSKQMVGIFLSVWARKELVPYIGHLRVSSMGRGIMGRLGNKGCISVSMSVHETSFCFVCSHLASGEKEGDELRRNADVTEILKNTQFNKICKNTNRRAPERISEHDRIIWLGDLNYRMALSYEETKVLLEDNDWDKLLQKDQLNIEREAGRAFSGFNEGRIQFAPTYKYSQNSDSYAGETVKSKKKRRTPAWCDRILWRGNGIEQISYIRGESRFSDHRPVCAVFTVKIELRNRSNKFRKGYSCAVTRMQFEDCIPQRHSFYEF